MISKIVISSLLVMVCTSLPYQILESGNPYAGPYGVIELKPQPYSFNIDLKDEYGTTLSRQEVGDDLGNKKGSYGYIDAYGISRQVDYIADDQGFRAIVKTNEPGTDNQNPADVDIISNAVPSAYGNPSAHSQSFPTNGTLPTSGGPQLALRQVNSPKVLGVSPSVYNSVSSEPALSLNRLPLY